MTDFLAVVGWFCAGLLLGVLPGVWLIASGLHVLGAVVIVGGYVLGWLVAELVVRVLEGKRG